MKNASDLRILDADFSGSEWLDITEAALYLRMLRKDGSACVERLRNLTSQGKIPYYKPFGRLLFKRSELNKQIETSRKGTRRGY